MRRRTKLSQYKTAFTRAFPILFFLLLWTKPAGAQVSFRKEGFNSVLQGCKSENKLLMIFAYTDWCRWCKLMEKETFSDSLVTSLLQNGFISVAYEMEKSEEGRALRARIPVRQFPTVLIFNKDGKLLHTIEGFSPPSVFAEELQRVQLNKVD